MADGGVRVSQIAYWPDHIPGNSTCHEPTTTPDWYPTLCHLGETEFPATQHIDGSNITDLLHDKEFERGPIFGITLTIPAKAEAPGPLSVGAIEIN